jgi:Co/Zn/Cd efflux system component
MKNEERKVTNADCNILAHAIGDLVGSVPTMKVGLLTYFKKIQKKLDAINSIAFKEQQTILKAHVKLDKNGGFILTEPTEEEQMKGAQQEYVYKKADGREKAEAEMKKLMSKIVNTTFEEIHPTAVANLDVNPAANQRFSVIMEMLFVQEEEEVKLEAV